MKGTAQIAIRQLRPDDVDFVMDSWLNSFRHSAFAAGVEQTTDGTLRCSSVAGTTKRGAIISNASPVDAPSRRLSMGLTDTVFFYEHRVVAERLLSGCTVDVACPQDDPHIILGWSCVGEQDGINVVHYVYTKRDFRRQGIAGFLLKHRGIDPSAPTVFTHMPPPVFDSAGRLKPNGRWKEAWLRERASQWVFDPYLLFHQMGTQSSEAAPADRVAQENE